jgi:nitrite reductase/ring-hydroxylating ferredoxin subunit
MIHPNRRQFLVGTTAAACACALCPEALGAAAAPGPVAAGKLADYAADGIYDSFAASARIMIVRKAGRVYATTSVCTHQSGALAKQGDGLACPRHGSTFDAAGKVTKGPATATLARYAISADAEGKITVDTSKRLTEAQWNDANAFLKV